MHAMKAYRTADVWIYSLLTLALDGNKLSTSGPGRFVSATIFPTPVQYEARWAPQLIFMFWENKNFFAICQDSKHGQSSPKPSHYTNWAIPAHMLTNKQY